MHVDFLLEIFKANSEKDAIIWNGASYDYKWLLSQISKWKSEINNFGIPEGAVVIIEADFSPNSISLFLALIGHSCILVPITTSVGPNRIKFIETAQGEYSFQIDEKDEVQIKKLRGVAEHGMYQSLRANNHPGLVLFSSGSTGESKAAVHDLTGILDKFKMPRHGLRSITFLLYDHIGGVNTMLYNLSNAGCIITVNDRTPDSILNVIEQFKVELLPTSPTFINLILLSEAYKRYDISSLKTVTYGTEPMPESTLKQFNKLFPDIRLLQTYGLSEVGILRSKSRSSDSLWVKIGGDGFETRIIDGLLEIKAKSAMLGYLNAPSPFTEDGWFKTGDAVEVDGDYMLILGRKSELINVGGEKVYPAEVESIVRTFDGVSDVSVYAEKNPITGNIVCARISLLEDLDRKEFKKRLKAYCAGRMEPYKIPVKIKITTELQHSERFKKMR